jgi:hypothetical protein
VEALTRSGLTRFHVPFVIALQTRRGEIVGIIRQPHGAWMLQVARNLIDIVDGFLKGTRVLLLLPPTHLNQPGPIVCRERLGGLLRYHRGRPETPRSSFWTLRDPSGAPRRVTEN